MKVILEVNALKPPLTGIGRYTLRLAQGLKTNPDVEEVKFFTSSGWLESIDTFESKINEGNISNSNLRSFLRTNIPCKSLARKGYQKYSDWQFKRNLKGLSDFIYHGPNYQLMPFSGRSVATIHDLSFIRHPEFHPKERVQYWQKEIYKVADRASHLITDSEFQRQEIIELLNVKPDDVSAVHLGVESKFRVYSEQACQASLGKYGLAFKAFNLVVATIEPRKNFERLLKAFQNLPVAVRRAYPLAVVGDKGWLSDDIHQTIATLEEDNEAVSLGYVDEADLPILYSAAAVFVYPSLYEGFGLPVLEAMASGTAVLTSNTTSIPEVAGDACVLVDPLCIEDITDKWLDLLESDERRKMMSSRGQERAKLFSWEKCTQNTINVYSKIS